MTSLLALCITCKSFAQTANYSPLYTNASFVKNIDLARPVGVIEGDANVSPTGAATYTVPIYTPPGTNGLNPSVSISYSSQAGSGVAGYGWSINGLSIVSRTGKNWYHNGKAAPVTYTDQDAFLIDGNRMNAVVGNNGANMTTYRTEAESFSVIVSYTSGSPNNPDKFVVTAKDGTIMEYGNTGDSKVLTDDGLNIMYWRLNRITDINGNYTDFIYINQLRDALIDEIKYSGNINTGLLPFNTIKFSYGYRQDVNTVYEAGASMSNYFLLNKITVKHKNDNNIEETVKTYNFNYGFDNVNSYLKEIEECGAVEPPIGTGDIAEGGGEPNPCLNSTIFLYGEQPSNITTFQSTLLTGNYDIVSGDYDADGYSDVLAASFDYDGDGVKKITSYSLFKEINNGGGATLMYSYAMPGDAIMGSSLTKQFAFLASDYNKDGKDDVLFLDGSIVDVGQTFLIDRVILNTTGELNTQTGFWNYTTNPFPYPVSGGYHYFYAKPNENFLVPGDFDGDGNQDYILIVESRPLNRYKAFLSLPSKNIINAEIADFGVGTNPYPNSYAKTIAEAKKAIPLDFNGDGKFEILVTRNNYTYIVSIEGVSAATGYLYAASTIYSTPSIIDVDNVFLGDFNGDRKTDILQQFNLSNGSYWSVLYNTGLQYEWVPFSFAQNVAVSGNTITDKIIVGDFNGDGKSDIAHGYNNTSTTSKISVYYCKGRNAATPFLYEQYDNNITFPSTNPITGDFNGDGRNDIISHFPGFAQFINIKPNGKEKLLMKVTNGQNVTTSFDYRYLTDKSIYPYVYNRTVPLSDPQNQAPYNYVQLALPVVSSLTMPDGIGGENITEYYYEDAIVHRHAKGFLGFQKVTAKNLVSGVTAIQESGLNTQFAVLYPVKETSKLTATNELLSENNSVTSFVNLSTGLHDIRYFAQALNSISKDNITGAAGETNNTYDNYGNVTTSVAKKGYLNGSSVVAVETTTTNITYGTHNTPFPAKPDNITVTNQRNGAPAQSVSTSFTYQPNGLPSSQTVYSGQPLAVTTSFVYNSFGNVTQTTKSASGVGNRVATATYDSKGRFPLIKEAIAGSVIKKETAIYDGKWGQPITQTSSECLTTSFEYDPYGRIKKTNLPEGYHVNTSLHWDLNGEQVFYSFTDFSAGKPDSKTWVDKAGREIKTQTMGFGGQWLTQVNTFNNKGQLHTKTNEYYPGETPFVTTLTYDNYGRQLATSTPISTITNTYTKLTNGQFKVTVQNNAGQSSSKTSDAAGKIIIANDDGGQLEFIYDSRGNQTETKHGTTVMVTSVYDAYGRQTSLTDKNAGTITYQYDAFGQLTQQTDANGNTYTMAYDDFGRITSRTGIEGTTTYEYYPGSSMTRCGTHQLKKVTGFNGVSKEYTYDALRRLETTTETVDGIAYVTNQTYDAYSNPLTMTYPSAVVVTNSYDNNGYLQTVIGGDANNPVILFTANAQNGYGQYTSYTLGNGKTSQNTYTHGIPTRLYTQGVQDLNFTFDFTKGNLTNRYDALKNLTEAFQYDNLDRLTTCTVNGIQQLAINYDGSSSFSLGNIASKTDAGNYVYSNTKIHAVNYITNPAGPAAPPVTPLPGNDQQITYTAFLKTASITEGSIQTLFTYGPDYQRIKTQTLVNGNVQTTKLFVGGMERVTSGYTRDLHYIPVGNSIAVIEKPIYSNSIVHFVYTDYLGSLLAKTDINGTVTAEQNFDAWGRRRNPANWQHLEYNSFDFYDRGYTGHEHLPYHGLINMNGRMYDPVQGRMLSPDNYVPDPWHTQGYNRYSYANNNPLKFTDPDGNFPWLAVGIAALVSGITNGVAYQNNGGTFMGGFWRGVIVGGLSAAMGATVAGLSVPFANTLGIVYGSVVSSGLSNALNGGGGSSFNLSFGFGSYDLFSGEFNYLGKKGNSFLANLGYSFGAMANLQDAISWGHGTKVEYRAEGEEGIPHARVYSEYGYDGNAIDISANHIGQFDIGYPGDPNYLWPGGVTQSGKAVGGFADGLDYAQAWLFRVVRGKHYPISQLSSNASVLPLKLYNVNGKLLAQMTQNMKDGLGKWGIGTFKYGSTIWGCQSHAARALLGVGIPTIPINLHPLMLYAQLGIRQVGILVSPTLINNR